MADDPCKDHRGNGKGEVAVVDRVTTAGKAGQRGGVEVRLIPAEDSVGPSFTRSDVRRSVCSKPAIRFAEDRGPAPARSAEG